VLMLVGVQDVGVVPVQELGDGSDDSLAVGAVDQQDAGLRHERPPKRSQTASTAIYRVGMLVMPIVSAPEALAGTRCPDDPRAPRTAIHEHFSRPLPQVPVTRLPTKRLRSGCKSGLNLRYAGFTETPPKRLRR